MSEKQGDLIARGEALWAALETATSRDAELALIAAALTPAPAQPGLRERAVELWARLRSAITHDEEIECILAALGSPPLEPGLPWKVPCPVCEGSGELREAVQAWDIPGVPVPECPHCDEGTLDLERLLAAPLDAAPLVERKPAEDEDPPDATGYVRCPWCGWYGEEEATIFTDDALEECDGDAPGATLSCPECHRSDLQDAYEPESATDKYERLAAAFHRESGMLAPGKDQPAAMGGCPDDDARQIAWDQWLRPLAAPVDATPPRHRPILEEVRDWSDPAWLDGISPDLALFHIHNAVKHTLVDDAAPTVNPPEVDSKPADAAPLGDPLANDFLRAQRDNGDAAQGERAPWGWLWRMLVANGSWGPWHFSAVEKVADRYMQVEAIYFGSEPPAQGVGGAEAVKKEVGRILHAALGGRDDRYKFDGDYIRWGLVEKDICAAIDKAAAPVEAETGEGTP